MNRINSDTQPVTVMTDPEEETLPQRKLKALEKAGVTRPTMYQRLSEGLSHGKTIIVVDDNGEPLEKFEPDMVIRHKYLETALKVFGDLRPDGGVNVGVGVNVGGMSKEEKELVAAYKHSTLKAIVMLPTGDIKK